MNVQKQIVYTALIGFHLFTAHRPLDITAYYLSLFPTDLRTGRLVVTAPSPSSEVQLYSDTRWRPWPGQSWQWGL